MMCMHRSVSPTYLSVKCKRSYKGMKYEHLEKWENLQYEKKKNLKKSELVNSLFI